MEPAPELTDAVVVDLCHLRIPSLPDWIEPTVDYLVQRARHSGAIPPGRTNRLMVALHEALTNAVIHGNLGITSELKERCDDSFIREVASRCANPAFAGKMVDVRASFDGQIARWILADQGDGFNYENALRRLDEEEPDATRMSGRGLMLIRAFMDEMRFEDRGRRLHLAMRKAPAEEQRGNLRYTMSRSVQVTPIDERGEIDWSSGQEALMRNVSTDGIGMLQTRTIPTGRVLITIPTIDEPIAVPAEVRHWHELGDRLIEVGCRFDSPVPLTALGLEPIEEDETSSAISRLVRRLAEQQRADSERRAAPRVTYTEPVEVELPDEPPLRGFARDLSRGGISFVTTRSLPKETITLSLPAGDESSLRLRAQVVRCVRLIDDFYDIGARFVSS